MPPGGGGEGGGTGEQRFGEQDHPPATGHECRDEEVASRSPPTPLLPYLAVTPVASQNKKMKREDEQQGEEQPAASFPEDVLIEILSLVPYISLFHFKCVSKQWLALCSDPDVRKRSPQTLSGFFYFNLGWRFQNLSGKSPPIVDSNLRFLRGSYKFFSIQQCSTSLLLCKCWKSHHPSQYSWNYLPNPGPGQCLRWPEDKIFDYVVCNPATQEWTLLPPIELPDHLSRFRLGKYFYTFWVLTRPFPPALWCLCPWKDIMYMAYLWP